MKQIVTTKFIAIVPIKVPIWVGGGWGGGIQFITKANPNDIIICETHQSPECIVLDSSVRIQFPAETLSVEFETLGRLIASGSIQQVFV